MANQVQVAREGADITADHMLIPEETPSEIRKFFDGSTIFITGGSGFIGNLTIEKILRACPDIKKIYMLMRPKKGKEPQERLEKQFKDPIYDRLSAENPKYFEKVSFMLGDCEQPELGLSAEDKQTLYNEVNIIFHNAATVRFDEKIRKAAHINIRGTRDLLNLSTKMTNIKAFVHVSTAFSNCPNPVIDEIFYDNDMTSDKLLEIIDLLTEEQLEAVTPTLIGKWPNTYTYTKAIAENVVREYGKKIPITIVRPSIVCSTYKEPIAGWANTVFGITGIAVGCGIGFIRTLHCIPDNSANLVPVDYCVNSIITSAWIVGQARGEENTETPNNVAFDDLKVEDNVPIFNYVNSPRNILTWRMLMKTMEKYGLELPSMLCVWYYGFQLQTNKYIHFLYVLFLHYFPAVCIDTALLISGRSPKLLKIYKKIHKLSTSLTYFTLKQWDFKNNNVGVLWNKLNETDKRLFEFDMDAVDWDEYILLFTKGGRVYLLKDPLDTLPQARRRYKKIKILHYTLITVFWLVVLKLVWMLASLFF